MDSILRKFEEFTLTVSKRQPQLSMALPIYYELHDLLHDAAYREGEFTSVDLDKFSSGKDVATTMVIVPENEHISDASENSKILIHSGAGGVGIAAIQLAQYKKADVSFTQMIFVTIGTDDKREFLANNFGVNRMFSSRNTKFAEEIRRETGFLKFGF
ncbi:hypothetical protein V1524DRAFT_412254, partial [Lipomyces starkeyi]